MPIVVQLLAILSTPKATVELKNIQIDNNLSKHQLIQSIATMWNSTYHILKRIYEQKTAIAGFLADARSLPSLDGYKWNLINKMSFLLKVIHTTTVRLSKRFALVLDIIPQAQILMLYIIKLSEDSRFLDFEVLCRV